MQRVHEKDASGLILARDLGYEHLMIPMEFEPDRRCHTIIQPGGVRGEEKHCWDPREQAGELMWPDRYDRPAVKKHKTTLGSSASAGQLQQRPAPGGGTFKRAWFGVVGAAPAGPDVQRVRRWDLAASEAALGADPDWTVGLRMSKDRYGVYYIEHVERFRGSSHTVETTIKTIAEQDGKEVKIGLLQDPGQAGKSQARYLVGMLAGHDARAFTESGSKETRATPLEAQAEAGNVKLVNGTTRSWTRSAPSRAQPTMTKWTRQAAPSTC